MVDTAEATTAPRSTRGERVGWYFYDFANSAFSTSVVTVFLGPYLGTIAERAQDAKHQVYPLGIPVAAGSLFSYAVSLSVLLTVFVLPIVGAIADRSSHKRELLGLFAYVGAGSVLGMVFLTGDRYLLGTVLFLVANISFGAANVVYNSFLPQIAGPDDRDRVSSLGWGIGYIGGGNRPAVAGEHPRGSVLTDGFRQLGQTLASLKAYPLTLFFLIAYLVYNDGIQTVIVQAGVYADKELGLSQTVRVEAILLVQFVAFAGAFAMGRIAERIGAWRTVLGSLVVWTVALGLAYFLPAHRALLFMLLAALIGIVLGGSQALSRSLFSQLIPHGKEAEYFGLYEISSDGTSWLGPLLFGLIYQITHTYRVAIISLLIFFIIGFVALLAVPIRRAIVEAGNVPPHVL